MEAIITAVSNVKGKIVEKLTKSIDGSLEEKKNHPYMYKRREWKERFFFMLIVHLKNTVGSLSTRTDTL